MAVLTHDAPHPLTLNADEREVGMPHQQPLRVHASPRLLRLRIRDQALPYRVLGRAVDQSEHPFHRCLGQSP